MSSQEDILRLQDVQLANAMSGLNNDPAKLNSFITQRKSDVYDSVTKEHSDNFQKVYGDLTRASDSTSNILYYHTRNKDLDNVQQAVFDRAKSEADAVTYDSQVAKRQTEINEWTSNNKLDTLFFLQILLMALTVSVPLIYLNKAGLIPSSTYYGINFLIIMAVVLTLIVRVQYTNKIRDNRFWNRRRFANMGGPPTLSCESLESSLDSAQDAIVNAGSKVQLAVSDASNRLESAYNAASKTEGFLSIDLSRT